MTTPPKLNEAMAAAQPQQADVSLLASAQISYVLTLSGMSFSTEREEGRRLWFTSFSDASGAQEVQITISVDGSIFAIEAGFTYGDLNLRDLYWTLQDRVPMVRLEPDPTPQDPPLGWACVALPVDRTPPFIMPSSIQTSLNAVLGAMAILYDEHPGSVHSQPAVPSRYRSWRKPPPDEQGALAPQKPSPVGDAP